MSPPAIKLCDMDSVGDYLAAPQSDDYNVSIISEMPETQDDIDYLLVDQYNDVSV